MLKVRLTLVNSQIITLGSKGYLVKTHQHIMLSGLMHLICLINESSCFLFSVFFRVHRFDVCQVISFSTHTNLLKMEGKYLLIQTNLDGRFFLFWSQCCADRPSRGQTSIIKTLLLTLMYIRMHPIFTIQQVHRFWIYMRNSGEKSRPL